MILNGLFTCQHGIKYDTQTLYCRYVACNYERRLKSPQCHECQMHKHNYERMGSQYEYKFSKIVQSQICELEYHILNETDLNFLKEQIDYGKSLIENLLYMENMPESLFLKTIQISQLLLNQNFIDDPFKGFIKFIIQIQENNKFQNYIEKADNYMLYKAYLADGFWNSITARSPNEKYLLFANDVYVYLYDISKKLTIKMFKFNRIYPERGIFSNDSSKIIFTSNNKILILGIQNIKKNIRTLKHRNIEQVYLQQNQLYLIQNLMLGYKKRLVRICLKTNRLIFSQAIIGVHRNQLYFSQDQIGYQFKLNLFIINSSTRKTILKIDLGKYQIQKLIVLNKNEILSLVDFTQLVIWNIDYSNSCLIQNNIIPLNAQDILQVQGFNTFFQSILTYKIFQVNWKKKNDCMSIGQYVNNINSILKVNSSQFTSDNSFIVQYQGWICILERINTG